MITSINTSKENPTFVPHLFPELLINTTVANPPAELIYFPK